MPIEIKMPALSPTMEEGTLAKWLVKEGDTVKSGDIMAEIETDKATMEFEAVDEGTIGKVLVAEGTDNVKVGAVIAILLEEGEDASAIDAAPKKAETPEPADDQFKGKPDATDPNKTGSEAAPAPAGTSDHGRPAGAGAAQGDGGRVKASPLARRIAADKGLELSGIAGSGPNGRIVKADVENAKPSAASAPKAEAAAPAPSAAAAPAPAAEVPKPAAVWFDDSIPHTVEKLSNIRKTIARRLTESKQQVPHIYLTVDVRLDALLKLRGDLNKSLDARGVKLSVNDLLIKALGVALENSPKCNVTFLGNEMVQYARADVSVAVSTPTGLITPIIRDAANKGVAKISTEMKDLAGRAKENKLKPEEYQGGTASLSNMGMFGIKQFEAVINPPQGMILAVGAGEKRPYIVDDALGVATVMTATGSFDHRAIDGADGAEMLKLFKALVESPLGLIA
ncbi:MULTISPECIES: pyruvate dehydrogenase complex dihydrolipoamide acetyltransferase [Sphingomonas]|jgi:pyruvate dehydrogenase E2 component (dihydrolipoamide acetyltransferase)|uniref:Acetyltransferase component of pyruvate dehydrogenase complex n=1 Tax=Sphingomonas hankookensis TaxID=563996 RepID=A0ABR5Y8Z0_9SPHN|nr:MULTISPECIES: pyruvate dehydrogenase complex dihydrolipoamide acetyltransferase [Sphingomonas]KZE08574.1 branched-chain alpha-keto acid dehydrogenase subunit E2 [Sphingomonas hankookensis]PZT92720.1 MAG: pyruvate dehydrogenase complex dihydrolipoamide acetyltransferase [Sphingomonas sp.]WCP71328.1 pyruvate dehydrogenase complex dihydrolipoamide acetyltransferase [Sphingomonas hankookensis]